MSGQSTARSPPGSLRGVIGQDGDAAPREEPDGSSVKGGSHSYFRLCLRITSDYVPPLGPVLIRSMFRVRSKREGTSHLAETERGVMPTHERRLGVNLNIKPAGGHTAAWKHPRTDPRQVNDIAALLRLAVRADRGGVDAFFFADKLVAVDDEGTPPAVFEPLTLLGAIAAVTTELGLIGTISTTFSDPFVLARQVLSLDHISAGRAAWNAVTSGSPGAAPNFGLDELPAHDERYERAAEFIDVVRGLWGSWAAEALVLDQENGRFWDRRSVRSLDHSGAHFRVAGPLNSLRSPQGAPLVFQAGMSDAGRELGARHADGVYASPRTLSDAIAFRDDIRRRALLAGRGEDSVAVFASFRVIVGPNRAQAERTARELDGLVDYRSVLGNLALIQGIDLRGYDPDGPIPELPDPAESQGYRSFVERTHAVIATHRPPTIRELARILGSEREDSETRLIGDAADVADTLQTWFEAGAVDGVNLTPELLQGGAEDVIDLLLPELERRGIHDRLRAGTTLRERYRIPPPPIPTQQ
ncbi:NtaA/DmoA family FMN-dependent monooxygenase [Agromyces intestinalis]|uniref:NtaA/DmoA family FMN-dependent monooxygenase n=1 Tax=Agromyces intestinalis TaxID=2592652 RepID=UPI00143D5C48|nr:NtaA/DmoA family FMN-dependent monooxygenase [Agromyces intestinalis]